MAEPLPRDPDPNGEMKERWERRMARIVAAYLREQRERIRREVGLNLGIVMIPGELFWDEEQESLRKTLQPEFQQFMFEIGKFEMEQVFRRKQLAEELTPEAIMRLAVQRAVIEAGRIAQQMTGTTRRNLRAALEEFFNTSGFTIGDVIDRLEQSISSPVRAQATAVTEITRTAREGQKITTELIQSAGYEVEERWWTNNDGLVCPICAPRHGQIFRSDWEQPAHVNCRCWSSTRFAGIEIDDQELAPAIVEQGATPFGG